MKGYFHHLTYWNRWLSAKHTQLNAKGGWRRVFSAFVSQSPDWSRAERESGQSIISVGWPISNQQAFFLRARDALPQHTITSLFTSTAAQREESLRQCTYPTAPVKHDGGQQGRFNAARHRGNITNGCQDDVQLRALSFTWTLWGFASNRWFCFH